MPTVRTTPTATMKPMKPTGKAVPPVMSSIGFPIASGPALHGLIIAGHRDTEGSWRRAGGLVIGAERGSTGIEHRVLVASPATINVTLEHRHGRLGGGRGWIHRFDGVGWGNVRMLRQATLLDHGPVALEYTASTQLETTNPPHPAHLLRRHTHRSRAPSCSRRPSRPGSQETE